jgi:hypothetical protein
MGVRAKSFNKVPPATRWYTPSTILTVVRLQQLIVANLEILPESTASKLTNTLCNKAAARSKGVQTINENDHEKIIDEIAHCAILDFYKEDDDGDEQEDDDRDNEEEEDDDDNSNAHN